MLYIIIDEIHQNYFSSSLKLSYLGNFEILKIEKFGDLKI